MKQLSILGKEYHGSLWVFICVVGAQIGLAQPGLAFECPVPQVEGVQHDIPESQKEITELSALLRSGDLEDRLEVIARDLKQKYPKADKAELTNFMVSAYCPVIAADHGLSDSEKRERLDGFNDRVWQIYSDPGL